MGFRIPLRRGAHLTAITLAIAFAFIGLSAWSLQEVRRENWERASLAARNLSRAVTQELARTIESLDLSLQAVVDNSRIAGVEALDPALRDLLLFDRAATAPHLGAILLLDESGNVLLESRRGRTRPGSRAGREYFAYHRDHPDGGLHVSRPFIGATDGEWLVAVTRRLSQPDGEFAGVVVGSIRLSALRAMFEDLDLGPGGSLTLYRADGAVLMRIPYREAVLGSDISGGEPYRRAMQSPSGQFIAEATLDRVRRLYTHSRVQGTPLLVNVSLSVADIEVGWRRYALRVGLVTLTLVGALVGAALLLRRELRKRHEAELAARESASNFRLLAENCSDMVSRIGSDGVRRYVSPASRRIYGRTPESLVGRRPQEQAHPADVAAVTEAGYRLHSGAAEEATITYRARHANGAWVWVESTIRVVRDPETGQRDGLVAVTRDVTERKAMEAELARLATLDGLTGIANRRSFDGTLEREWLRCARAEHPISVLLIDVDHFKALNDHYGHQRGDQCLRQVGAVIGTTIRRASDLAARYGGEEFVILLPETDAAGALAVAERVRAEVESLALPHAAAGAGPVVTVSIGCATAWPLPGGAAPGLGALVALADQGLYEAKRSGRNRVVPRLETAGAAVPEESWR